MSGDDVDDDDTCYFEAKHGDGVVALGIHYTAINHIRLFCSNNFDVHKNTNLMLEGYTSYA